MEPGMKLAKWLKQGDRGINCFDKLAKQQDIDNSRTKNLRDKRKIREKMIKGINQFTKETWTKKIVKNIMQAKKKLEL